MANGRRFEIRVQEVFQAILDQSPMKGTQVRHNVILQGNDGPHQIDDYYEFEVTGIIYRHLVSAKDWKSRVKKGHLHEFNDILSEIPGKPRGIVVARSGYQKGAKTVATKNEILTFQLEPVTHDGPLNLNATTLGYARFELRKTPLYVLGAGRIGYSYITLATVFEPDFKGSRFKADLGWMSERYRISRDEAFLWVCAINIHAAPHEIQFFGEDGKETTTLARVYRGFVDKAMKREGKPHRLTHRFETGTFLRSPDSEIPILKIDAISTRVTVKKQQCIERAWPLLNMELYILRNLSDGTVLLVGKKVTPAASTGAVASPGSAA